MNRYAIALSVTAAVWGLAARSAQAGPYYWDSNTNTAGFGTAQGTWAAPTVPSGTQGWSTDSTGSSALNSVTTATSDSLNFGNGSTGLAAGTITISGTVDAGNLTFASGSGAIVLQTGRINLAPAVTITLSNSADTISGVLDGAATSLTKQGTGTLTLSANVNQFTGPTIISAGKIALGAQYALWKSPYDTTGSDGSNIGLNLGAVTAPVLGGLAGSSNLASAITAGYGSVTALTLNPQTGTSVSYGGVIANGAANMSLIKTGPGTQTLTGANTYSGGTTNYAGTLTLAGAAGAIASTSVAVYGGTLSLDNSGGTWVNRIPDAATLSLGSLTLKSDNGGVAQTETVGATALATSGKITVDNGTGAGTTLALGTVTRSAGAAIDFVGTGGTLGSSGNNPNVTSTGSWPNPSGGVGTWILPYATVNGTQWAEDNANSIRAYAGALPALAGATSAQNARETAGSSLGGAATANSLNIASSGSGTQTLALGANNLTLGSGAATPGAILKSGTDAWIISGSSGQVRAGSGGAGTELIAHVDGGDLTISAPLNTAIVGLAKGGTGKLILSGTRAGTLSGAISIAGTLELQNAATTISGAVSGPGGVTVNLNAGQMLTISGFANTYSGPTVVKGGILRLNWGGPSFPGVPGSDLNGTQGQGLLSNLEINGGIVSLGYYSKEFLGSGNGQIQITGGTSGFANHQADASGAAMWLVNNDANYEVVWGSTYFKPDVFVLQGATGVCGFRMQNKFDLNGATRTMASYATGPGDATYQRGSYGSIEGVIRDSAGGSAGITKIGPGDLQLTAANTFNGVVTVNGGTLTVCTLANGGSASGLGASSAAASNLLIGPGATLRYSNGGYGGYPLGIGGGVTSSDRSFTLNGTANGDFFTLDASGTGALVLNSTATPGYGTSGQTRTLILTGTYTGTNTLAASLTDNGGAAVSVTKNGAGTWVLSGNSSYTGPTTLSAGELGVSAAANLGAASANLVFNGGTLQIVGTGLTSLSALGRTVVANPGVTVGLNITNAANTFTVDQAITGAVSVVKTGPGTLVFSTNNSYSGSTTISGGVLQYNDNSTIPTTPLLNNAALVINRSLGNTLTQGVNFHSIMYGTGSLTNIGGGTLELNNINLYSGNTKAQAGTIALSHAQALQNSPLDTTGGGFVTLSGVTAPILGGLTQSGAPRDLATVISSGYGSVTNLTLNPSGSVTNGGVIANGASGMALTMAGSGTQVLTNSSTYSGATILKAGTLQLSGNGAILNSAINLSGGGLLLSYGDSDAEKTLNRVSDTAPVTANGGGTLTYTTAGSTRNFAETLGTNVLTSGQLNIVESANMSGGSQTLTLGGLTQSGSAAVTFSATGTAPQASGNRNMIVVTGASGAGTGQNLPGGLIIGPWATAGTAANAQTDYAVYDASGYVLPANITASAETTWTTTANAYTLTIPAKTASALTLTRNITALKESSTATAATAASGTFTVASTHSLAVGDPVVVSGFGGDITGLAVGTVYYVASVPSGTTFTLAATPGGTALNVSGTVNFTGGLKLDSGINLGASGILNSGAAPFGIGRTATGGNVTLPTAGAGNLYVTAGTAPTGAANSGLNGWIIIDAPIVDNGGALTLVKSGAGVLRLSGTNTYTGGTIINAGVVAVTSSNNLGAAGSPITFNGSGALSFGPNNSWAFASGGSPDLGTHPIMINNGAVAGLYYNSPNTTFTISGAITGDGGIIVGGTGSLLTFNGGAGSDYASLLSPSNSFTGPLTLGFDSNGGLTVNSMADSISPITSSGGGYFALGAGATANLSVTNRPIYLNSSGTIKNMNATYTMTLGAVSATTAGAKTLTLDAGVGTIAGQITDGSGAISVYKSGTGTWTLSQTNNTFSGTTSSPANGAGGTLVVTKLANGGQPSSIGLSSSAAANLVLGYALTLKYVGAGDNCDRKFTISMQNDNDACSLDASGTGPLNLTSTNAVVYGTANKAWVFNLTGNNADDNTLAASIANNGTSAIKVNKTSNGKWRLSGANTFTGPFTMSGGGTLVLDYATQDNSKLSDTSALTLSGGTVTLKDGAHTEVVLSTTLDTAGTFLNRSGSSGGKITLGAITRAVGSTIDFADATIADTTQANVNNILGGWATVGGTNWAMSGSPITAYSSYTALPKGTGSSVTNFILTGSQTQTNAVAANTVKLANSGTSDTLTLAGNNLTTTYTSATSLGGILYVGGNDNNYNITGTGTIIPGTAAGELIMNVATGTLNVTAPIIGNGAGILTKTGAGTLVLNTNSLYTGATYINQGTVRLGNAAAAGTTGAINIRNGAALELAGGINIGSKAINSTGNGVSNGGALRSVSGTNTYGAALTVGTGGTRINSDSGSLLILTNTITTASGNDLTVGGAGNVTISNVISGAGGVVKDGSGTLTLTTNNTYTGATMINGGTLVVATGGSCSNSAVTVASAGTLQIRVTDNTKQWTCASLALNNGSQVRYTFSVTPSTNLAPLNVLGNLTFSGTPTIVVDKSKVAAGQIYPLLVVGGTAPTALPALGGSVAGKLAWGGPGNKTLYLTTSTGMVLILE